MALRLCAARSMKSAARPFVRRLTTPAEALANSKKELEAFIKMEPYLPAALKFVPDFAKKEHEMYESFASKYPELNAEILKRVSANPDAEGIVATTAEPRDPATCKYTLEGSVEHGFMANVFKTKRFYSFLFEGLEIELVEEDRKKVLDAHEQKYLNLYQQLEDMTANMEQFEGGPPLKRVIPPLEIPKSIPAKEIFGGGLL